MGKHKEEHGKTRAGKFLQGIKGIAPSILSLAATVTGVGGLNELASAIRSEPTLSEEDRATALEHIELDMVEMKEVTKRWESDNVSDSWLSKNIRPLVVSWLVVFVSFFALIDSIDSIGIKVEAAWITLFSTLLVTVIVAYFGSRGVEKYKKISK